VEWMPAAARTVVRGTPGRLSLVRVARIRQRVWMGLAPIASDAADSASSSGGIDPQTPMEVP